MGFFQELEEQENIKMKVALVVCLLVGAAMAGPFRGKGKGGTSSDERPDLPELSEDQKTQLKDLLCQEHHRASCESRWHSTNQASDGRERCQAALCHEEGLLPQENALPGGGRRCSNPCSEPAATHGGRGRRRPGQRQGQGQR